ncbi:hypothetical protein A2U01_0049363, partial [Trifolium medium]|nr:hypothetical protein [Trifolium medium]
MLNLVLKCVTKKHSIEAVTREGDINPVGEFDRVIVFVI